MQFRFHIAVFLAALALNSCYSYKAIRISGRVLSERSVVDKSEEVLQKTRSKYRVPGRNRGKKIVFRMKIKKYLAVIYLGSPLAVINNRGVKLAVMGRFSEAGILFGEVIKEGKFEGAGYNNLGVIYELFDNRERAFKMYSEACLLAPGNSYFRRNFLTFTDKRKKAE